MLLIQNFIASDYLVRCFYTILYISYIQSVLMCLIRSHKIQVYVIFNYIERIEHK